MSTAQHAAGAPTAATSSIVSAAETAAVDALAGIKNLFAMVSTGVQSATRVATAGNTSAIVSGVVGGLENMVSGDGGAFISAVGSFVADIEAKKWGSTPKDVEACLKTGFAILSKFGVNIPVASAVIAALPDIPAIA